MTLKDKQQQAKIAIAEATSKRAIAFKERVQYFLNIQRSKGNKSKWLTGCKLSDLLYMLPTNSAERSLSSHYLDKIPQHHICAEIEGLIEIDKQQRPYRYRVLKQSDTIVLRPYQRDIVVRVIEGVGNTLIQSPTGSGKSVIAKEILQQLTADGKKALIVAPKINLLQQLSDTFRDLNPQIIHSKAKYDVNQSVFISTVQTAHKRDLGFEPDIILIDEVHFGFSGKMIEQLLKDFKGRLIGLSATPYDKKGELLKGFDVHINKYDVKYLIEHNYLTPIISYQPIKVDLKNIRITAGDYNLKDLDNKFNNIESVSQVVEATKEVINKRVQTMVFCVSISHSELMAKAYRDIGIDARIIHSQLSRDEVEKTILSFKGKEFKVLCNVDMATTGFDVPSVDTIVLARATKSQNLYKQIVGRGLRIAPNKKECVLLDCAGVISDLGLPLSPITPKKSLDTEEQSKSRCSECGSERVYRTLKDTTTFKVCAECGHKELIEPNEYYLCEHCNKFFNPKEAKLQVKDSKIILECDECSGYTVVSEVTDKVTLEAIFDKEMIDLVQRRFMASYVSEVISSHGYEFITSQLFKDHSEALIKSIEQQPMDYTQFDKQMIREDRFSIVDFTLTQTQEQQSTNRDEQILMSIRDDIQGAFELYNMLRPTDMASQSLIDKVVSEANRSKVDVMHRLVVKRIKNIYKEELPIKRISNFVQYIESQEQ